MNLALLDRYLLYRLDAITQGGTVTSGTWGQEERLFAINLGNREVCRRVRFQRVDHFTVWRRSTDAASFIYTEKYTPATALKIRNGVSTITLPPDYLELRQVRSITSGREHVAFDVQDANSSEINTIIRAPAFTGQVTRYIVQVEGIRTARLFPTPTEDLDIEVAYVQAPPPLVLYSTGTVASSTVADVTTVTGTGTAWSAQRAGIYVGDEIAFGTTMVAPTMTLNTRYQRIATITDTTHLVLGDSLAADVGAGTLYQIASVPPLLADHHPVIVCYAVYELLSKAVEVEVAQLAQAAKTEWERAALLLVGDTATRSSQDLKVAADGWEVFGG